MSCCRDSGTLDSAATRAACGRGLPRTIALVLLPLAGTDTAERHQYAQREQKSGTGRGHDEVDVDGGNGQEGGRRRNGGRLRGSFRGSHASTCTCGEVLREGEEGGREREGEEGGRGREGEEGGRGSGEGNERQH